MIRLILLGAALLLTQCSSSKNLVQNTDPLSPIFRYTTIDFNQEVLLGESFNVPEIYTIKEEQSRIRIPISNSFTNWIRVYITDANIVGAMVFAYNLTYEAEKELQNYKGSLGEPRISKSNEHEIYYWQDDSTRFEIVKRTRNKQTEYFSILSDLRHAPKTTIPELQEINIQNAKIGITDILTNTAIGGLFQNKKNDVIELLKVQYRSINSDTLKLVEQVVENNFSLPFLYKVAHTYMSAEYKKETVDNLSEWLFSDEYLIQNAKVTSFTDSLDIEAFAQKTLENRPSQERVQLILRLLKANQVGEFFHLIDLSIIHSANMLLLGISKDLSLIQLPTKEESDQNIENYNNYFVVSFLKTYQPLDNNELRFLAEGYESSAGSWYVITYIDALIEALNTAAYVSNEELKKLISESE